VRNDLRLAWQTNWAELDRRYGGGGFAWSSLVASTGNFYTAGMLQDLTDFFATHPAPAAQREVARAKEEIAGAVRWLAANAQGVCGHFANGGGWT